jgi:hypothetical protein
MEQAFGPDGLGFLEVTHIPNDMFKLQKQVLQLAPKLAQLPHPRLDDITRPITMYTITIGWSHGQEEFRPGVPNTRKASFYFDPYVSKQNVFPLLGLPDMEALVMEMTHFMTQVRLWISQLCAVYLQHKHNKHILYESLKFDPSISLDCEASMYWCACCVRHPINLCNWTEMDMVGRYTWGIP